MEEQIISFETSKMLWELINFPWNIPNWYDQIGTLNYSHTAGEEFHLLRGIPAPTQTCLRRWLREKYDIHIIIEPYGELEKTIYEWTVISNLYEEEDEDNINFPSYEKALESALQESLKLVKSKNI
jgi:hypothetical protein